MHQIHLGSFLEDCEVELELINTWLLTGEKPCRYIIAILSIVDYLMKCNWLASFRNIVAQSHREGNVFVNVMVYRGFSGGWDSCE